MTNEELLEMVSKLSTELVETKKLLVDSDRQLTNTRNTRTQLDEVMDKADVPQIHIVNRVQWLIEKAAGTKGE